MSQGFEPLADEWTGKTATRTKYLGKNKGKVGSATQNLGVFVIR
jgi:hypothetical protein